MRGMTVGFKGVMGPRAGSYAAQMRWSWPAVRLAHGQVMPPPAISRGVSLKSLRRVSQIHGFMAATLV